MKPKSCPLSSGTSDPTEDGMFCKKLGGCPRVVSQNLPSLLLLYNVSLASECSCYSHSSQMCSVLTKAKSLEGYIKLCIGNDVLGAFY